LYCGHDLEISRSWLKRRWFNGCNNMVATFSFPWRFQHVGAPCTRINPCIYPKRKWLSIFDPVFSGNLTVCYWKWPIEIADLPNLKMVIFQFAFCMFTRGYLSFS
jgi:hypothetical protein